MTRDDSNIRPPVNQMIKDLIEADHTPVIKDRSSYTADQRRWGRFRYLKLARAWIHGACSRYPWARAWDVFKAEVVAQQRIKTFASQISETKDVIDKSSSEECSTYAGDLKPVGEWPKLRTEVNYPIVLGPQKPAKKTKGPKSKKPKGKKKR